MILIRGMTSTKYILLKLRIVHDVLLQVRIFKDVLHQLGLFKYISQLGVGVFRDVLQKMGIYWYSDVFYNKFQDILK